MHVFSFPVLVATSVSFPLPPFSLLFDGFLWQCYRQNPLCVCPERKLITEEGGEGELEGESGLK